jgi:hypothetical protein
VTFNLKDFPLATVGAYGIVAVEPDHFANYLLDVDVDAALAALAKMRGRLKNPSMMPAEFVDSIEKAGMPSAASRLRSLHHRQRSILLRVAAVLIHVRHELCVPHLGYVVRHGASPSRFSLLLSL